MLIQNRDTRTRVGKPLGALKNLSTPDSDGYFWAGESHTFDESCKHYVTAGSTGCGKSLTLNLLLRSVVLKMPSERGTKCQGDIKRRALVYDSKLDLAGFV